MPDQIEKPVGLTRDAGYQIGVRRTLQISASTAWRFLTSPDGVRLWLGETDVKDYSRGARYALPGGGSGEVRVFHPESHLRITWQPGDWPRASTIQLRVIPKGERCVIAFHQEHLPDGEARLQQREFFIGVLEKVRSLIEDGQLP
jgi:uncharacterized protein YndB with AHSA1/START domain